MTVSTAFATDLDRQLYSLTQELRSLVIEHHKKREFATVTLEVVLKEGDITNAYCGCKKSMNMRNA